MIFLATVFLAVSCNNGNEADEVDDIDTIASVENIESDELPSTGNFGENITDENAVVASTLTQQMKDKDSLEIKLVGQINEVCQKKGCWMTMMAGNESMRIVFKDYDFFVPKDASGKEAVIKGTAYRKVTSVDDLRHYAEDEGKSKEEIAAITQPKEEIEFVADGVIIR